MNLLSSPDPWIALCQSMVRASLHATLLVGVILVLQKVFRRWLTPQWSYALWFLVALRLLMPTLPSSRISLMNLVSHPSGTPTSSPAVAAVSSTTAVTLSPLPERPVEQPLPSQQPRSTGETVRSSVEVWPLVTCTWIGGMAFLILLTLRQHRKIARTLRGAQRVANPECVRLLEECRETLRIRSSVALLETEYVTTPAIVGFWRPKLLLPRGLIEEMGSQDLRLIFLHELMHLRRWDLLFHWLWVTIQTIHWFNPVVWFALRRLRADRELACDAALLHQLPKEDHHAYGTLLIRLMEHFSARSTLPGAIAILNPTTELKRRIVMISTFQTTSHFARNFAAILLAAVGLVTLTGAEANKTQPQPVAAVSPKESEVGPAANATSETITRSFQALEQELQRQEAIIAERQHELDQLSQKLGIEDSLSGRPAANLDSGKIQRLESLRAEAQGSYEQHKSLYSALTNLSRPELKSAAATAVPDQALSKLLQTEADLELKMVEASVTHAPQSPTIQAHLRVKETLDRQIQERLDGILAGLRVQVESDQVRAAAFAEALKSAAASVQSAEAERAGQRRYYDRAKRELKPLEAMRDRLEERLIQQRIDQLANPELPRSPSSSNRTKEGAPSKSLTVEITKSGGYIFAGHQLNLDQLLGAIQETRKTSPDVLVQLQVSEQAPYRTVAALMEQCQAQGIVNVSLATNSKP